MMDEVCEFFEKYIPKLQVVQVNKRQIQTLTGHLGFNCHEKKKDKFIGGMFTLVSIILVLIPVTTVNIKTWINDNEPYISSIKFPYGFEGEFARNAKVTLDQVNTMIFMLKDYNDTTFSIADSESFLRFELVNYHHTFDESGQEILRKETHADFHDCQPQDMQKTIFE